MYPHFRKRVLPLILYCKKLLVELFFYMILAQVAMCNFPTIKDAADVAIATMHSGIQVRTPQLICFGIMKIKFCAVCWTSLLMYIHDDVLCMAPLSALMSLQFVACKSNCA